MDFLKTERVPYKTGEFALTDDELERLFVATDSFTELVFLRFAVSTGLRRSDVVAVKWRDVDFERRKVTFFERKKNRIKEVFLSSSMVQDLKRLRGLKSGEFYLFSGRSEPKYGKGHLSSRAAYDVLQRNLKKAGISPRPFHALRATCIKLCQRKGWSAEQTSKHVGDTIRVIQEHYSTPSDGEMLETADAKSLL